MREHGGRPGEGIESLCHPAELYDEEETGNKAKEQSLCFHAPDLFVAVPRSDPSNCVAWRGVYV